ncbi:MAG: 2-dehydropantoate 2-reductase [Proteobacteria bacterium]|nr:2-dehydropantoate 2-reductase [Pseudomonadota bacterium]
MDSGKYAVVGIGATGAVLAAALLTENPDTLLIDPASGARERVLNDGITISGAISYQVPVKNFAAGLEEVDRGSLDAVFIATKTFHLPRVLDQLKAVWEEGTALVSTHNGLGTEDLIAERFGPRSAFRMSLNLGAAQKAPGRVETFFFNRPNHLGPVDPAGREQGRDLADAFTRAGLDTEPVDDIKLYVWKKMIMKCSMASICAVTDRTIQGSLEFPPTRMIAENCIQEILAVAKAKGYDLGDDYFDQAMAYLDKVGAHKDSMCVDIANKTPTEIDFLGGKVAEYAR